ncbi:MAG: hypothetical protein ACFFB4_14080 [Promethearchaeota archaeon]
MFFQKLGPQGLPGDVGEDILGGLKVGILDPDMEETISGIITLLFLLDLIN